MTRRVLALAATAGLAIAAAPAAAQDEPISGFTAAGAEQQRAYEDAFTRGVSAESIGRNSRQLSRRTHLVGTPGDRRDQELSVQKLRSYGLDVATPSYSV
jgi:N-acetylated-alpha-linked acidic dipeptidase